MDNKVILKIVCYTPTLYILVGLIGRLEKYPFSHLDHEQIMIFDANEGVYWKSLIIKISVHLSVIDKPFLQKNSIFKNLLA